MHDKLLVMFGRLFAKDNRCRQHHTHAALRTLHIEGAVDPVNHKLLRRARVVVLVRDERDVVCVRHAGTHAHPWTRSCVIRDRTATRTM